LKKDRQIVYIAEEGVGNGLDGNHLNPEVWFIYLEENKIFYTELAFDFIQFEMYQNSNNKDEILLVGVEKSKTKETEDITENTNWDNFVFKHPEVKSKIREYKLNKIINK
jgi:hypothetical protein